MSAERSIRDHQREASASEAAGAFADELERRRLLRAGWSEECLESERKFGVRVARLYPLLELQGGVLTPKGQGTLKQALSGGCLVLLTRGAATATRMNGKKYRPLIEFPVEDVTPYRRGAQ